jgi:hypothetical protein
MVTRYYFTSSTTAPPNSPSFDGGWTRNSDGVRRIMRTTKDGTAMSSLTIFGNTNPAADATALAVQFSGPFIKVGTQFLTTATFKCYIRCMESATNDNLNRQPIAIKIYNGTTLQATLKSLGHYGPNTTEWVNGTLTSKTFGDGDTMASHGSTYTTVAGDYLVVELGGQVSGAGGSSVTGSLSMGSNSGTDIAENETVTAANNPWIEFSTDIFQDYRLDIDVGSYAVSGVQPSLQFGHRTDSDVGSYTLIGVDPTFVHGYKTDPDVGSYSLTGVEPTFLKALQIVLAVGSYTLTGIDVDMSEGGTPRPAPGPITDMMPMAVPGRIYGDFIHDTGGITMDIDAGVYALSGVEPSLAFGRKVSPDVGSYTLSGVDPALLHGHVVSPDVGSYAVTGIDPSLLFGHTIIPDVGAYSLTGVDPALLQAHVVAVDVGSYSVIGVEPELIYTPTGAFVLNCNVGSYTLTGANPSLEFNRAVATDIGNYTMVGVDPALSRGCVLAVDVGAYTLSGIDPALQRAAVMATDAGNYALSGVDPMLLRGQVVSPDIGTYALTGIDPSMSRGKSMSIDAGVYSQTGNDLTFSRIYILTTEAGTYSLTGVDPILAVAGTPRFLISAVGFTTMGISANGNTVPSLISAGDTVRSIEVGV